MDWTLFLFSLTLFHVFIRDVSSSGHYENVALHKACNMSSRWNSHRSVDAAVNNKTSGKYDATNCILTNQTDYNPWWEVDLSRPYPVYNITVWATTVWLNRMKNCVITVDGVECYRFAEEPKNRKIPISCTGGVLNGTVIRMSKKKTNESYYNYTINMCEFQVFSCSDPYWGSGCNRECGHCSDGEVCDKVTGHCSSCSVGWVPPLCNQECPPGTYGLHCTQNCSVNCDDSCDKASGSCTCKPGFKTSTCAEEIDECDSAPCQNGATCTDQVNSYTCQCPSGYTGLRCQTEIDKCDSAPCQNGATCTDQVNSYSCQCPFWYTGPQCHTARFSVTAAVIGCSALVITIVVIVIIVFKKKRQSQHDEPERTERQSQENTFSLPAAISNQTVSINGAFNTQEENEDPDFVNAIHFDNNSSSSYEKIDVAAMEAAEPNDDYLEPLPCSTQKPPSTGC